MKTIILAITFVSLSLKAATVLPCPPTPGEGYVRMGSAACRGIVTSVIPIPTAGLSLFHNTHMAKPSSLTGPILQEQNEIPLDTYSYFVNFGMGVAGWRLSVDKRFFELYDPTLKINYLVSQSGSGKILRYRLHPKGYYVANDNLEVLSRVYYDNTTKGYREVFNDGTTLIYNKRFYFPATQSSMLTLDKVEFVTGNSQTINRNSTGQITEIVNSFGKKISLSYSGPLLITIRDLSGESYTLNYGTSGELIEVTYPTGKSYDIKYDGLWNVTKLTDEKDQATKYSYATAYNGHPYLFRMVTPKNYTYYYEYNKDSVKVSLPLLNSYQAEVLEASSVTKSDSDGVVTKLYWGGGKTYRAFLMGVEDFFGDTTSYAYDDQGRIKSITSPNGKVTKITVDDRDRPTKIERDAFFTAYSYNKFDLPVSITSSTGDTISISRVNDLAPQTITKNGKALLSVKYTAGGNPSSITTDGLWTSTLAYDTNGNPDSVTNSDGDKTEFDFDNNGLVMRTVSAGVATKYERASDGSLTKVVSTPSGGSSASLFSKVRSIWASGAGNGPSGDNTTTTFEDGTGCCNKTKTTNNGEAERSCEDPQVCKLQDWNNSDELISAMCTKELTPWTGVGVYANPIECNSKPKVTVGPYQCQYEPATYSLDYNGLTCQIREVVVLATVECRDRITETVRTIDLGVVRTGHLNGYSTPGIPGVTLDSTNRVVINGDVVCN